MKKFSFQLEPVLKYKSDILEVRRNEHSRALKAVVDQENHIQELENEKKAFMLEFEEKKKGFITVVEASVYQSYLQRQNAVIRTEYTKLKQLQQKEEEKRNIMIEAKKEKLSIEKLREIKVGQYNQAVQKENETFIEEFVSNSRIRMQRS